VSQAGASTTSISNGTSNVSIATSGGNVVVVTNGNTAVTYDTSQNAVFVGVVGTASVFFENGQTVSANYTVTAGKNAGSFGPISINSGVTVTVPTGSVWSIV
jgi:hypothetical protein